MAETRVASRYARSLIGLAIEKNELEQVHSDMQLVAKTIGDNRDLALLLKNPIVKPDKKKSILESIFSSTTSAITGAFIKIIVTKGRETLLHDIALSFLSQYKIKKGILTAELTTAITLDQALKDKIVKLVNPNNQAIEVIEKVDKNIIGGFIVRVDDKQVDASIQSKIAELKLEFSKNPYVAEF
jgi:F-type H+-transporting ATPase subunit delta